MAAQVGGCLFGERPRQVRTLAECDDWLGAAGVGGNVDWPRSLPEGEVRVGVAVAVVEWESDSWGKGFMWGFV